MPKKKDQAEQPAEGVLESAAKTIGTVVGKAVAAVSGTKDQKAPEAQKSQKVPKFEKKDKSRLPRKQKKAQRKAAQTK